MKLPRITAIAAILALSASPAFAHIGLHETGDFTHGALHPLSGVDHLLAMVAVGFYAARQGGRALWFVPTAFVALMAVGGVLGFSGLALPYVEPIIAVSVIVMGALLAFDIRLPLPASAVMVGTFALFHGHAHGTEGVSMESFASYALGFVLATTILHGIGIALGKAFTRSNRTGAWAGRIFGAVGCVAGAMLLAS
ncbi:HupE/UreJ family protein [Dongia sp.]|uniref:HupE/UreJ family protein n=1 Tax=Dongia sp. TaxID=1977262 RepID=UPI0035B2FF8A